MMYRFYQDLATAHITELEREAQDARLARRRGVHVKSKLSNLSGLASRLVARRRQLPGPNRPGFRAWAGLSLVPAQCEFDAVADYSIVACEELGGPSHISHLHSTGIIDSQMSLEEEGFASTKPKSEEEHRAVQCVAQYRCQVQ